MRVMVHALLLDPSPVRPMYTVVYHLEMHWPRRMYSDLATLKEPSRRHWTTSQTAYACGDSADMETCFAGSRTYYQVRDVVKGEYRRWEEGSSGRGRAQIRAVSGQSRGVRLLETLEIMVVNTNLGVRPDKDEPEQREYDYKGDYTWCH